MATKKQVQELEDRIEELEDQLRNARHFFVEDIMEHMPSTEAMDFLKTLAPLAITKDQVITLARILSRN